MVGGHHPSEFMFLLFLLLNEWSVVMTAKLETAGVVSEVVVGEQS